MVKFNLPKNSKILKGRYFKDTTGSSNLKIVHIYRWNPEKKDCAERYNWGKTQRREYA